MRLRALIFASIIALAAHAQKVILRGATVLGMTGASPRAADLVLEGERIAGIVPPGTGRGERVIDPSGKFVLPGLADLHAHVLVEGQTRGHRDLFAEAALRACDMYHRHRGLQVRPRLWGDVRQA